MVGAADKLIDEFLRCAICTEIPQKQCTLVCYHTFCRKCVVNYTKTKPDAISAKSLLRPFCKMTKVSSPEKPVEGWADDVKPSFAIQGLLDSYGPGLKRRARTAFFGDSIQAIKELSWLTTMPGTSDITGPNNGSTDMPQELRLMLHTLQESMELKLTLSPVNTVNMPVYSIHNTGGNYTSTYSEAVNENCGLYRNMKYHGAFVCRQGANGQFDIMGTMLVRGHQYRLWPADTNSAGTAHIHVMRSIKEPEGRAMDYLIRNTSRILSEADAIPIPPVAGITQTYTVELVIHTDFKDYTNFQQRFGITSEAETIDMMSLWYSSIAEFITLTYGTVVEDDPDINILVKTIGLVTARVWYCSWILQRGPTYLRKVGYVERMTKTQQWI
ncbi:uncharacterized protein [Haliotis cracherodii]|uniref:uncharacterized protein n=1 Tax=Haliotis cracherodii TaxID=6455 RepID=UPI0039ECED71